MKAIKALVMLAVAGWAGRVWGQAQILQNGQLFDKNNQIGSYGSNTPVPGYVPINGNDIITGNVTGLGYFHGNIPYRNPYDFQGNLPSDRLNAFARQSAPAGASGTFLNGYRPWYSSNIAAGRDARGQIIRPQPVGNGYGNAVTPSQAISPVSGVATSSYAEQYSRVSAALAQGQVTTNVPWQSNPEDSPWTIVPEGEVSPLYGTRIIQRDTNLILPIQRGNALYGNMTNDPNASNIKGATTQPGTTSLVRTDVNQDPLNGELPNKPIDGQVKVGPVVAGPLEGQVGVTHKPADTAAAPDPYEALLVQLQAAQQQKAESSKVQSSLANPNGAVTQPGSLAPKSNGPATRTGLRPLETKRPDEGKTGLPNERTWVGLPGMMGRAAPDLGEGDKEKGNAELDRVRSGQTVPAMGSFAGAKPTQYNDAMRDAENLLKRGQYLYAMDAYDGAINLEPANPLGIIGRAQAELGAGLYETATYDMLFVYGRKPELMTVHYDLSKFLPKERVDFLMKDLAGLSGKHHVESAWFLQAYMQYQLGQDDAMVKTLDEWSQANPKNAWPATLKKAWEK
jgi:hypothetical protein